MTVTDFFAGEIVTELLKHLMTISRKSLMCKSSAESPCSSISEILPIIQEIKLSSVELTAFRQHQLDHFSETLRSGLELAAAALRSNCWNIYESFRLSQKRTFSISSNPAFALNIVSTIVSPHSSFLFNSQNPIDNSKLLPKSQLETPELLITHYQNSCSSADATKLHLWILKSGLTRDVFLFNTLINVPVKIGNLVLANKLFDEMPERNSVTWASLVCGYSRYGMLNESCLHFKRMLSSGALPNHYALSGALRACQESVPQKIKLGFQIHGLISKTWHGSDTAVGNSLISMYGNCLSSTDDGVFLFFKR